ncbi:hypothetical protein D3C86_2224300 [compost metagenome]
MVLPSNFCTNIVATTFLLVVTLNFSLLLTIGFGAMVIVIVGATAVDAGLPNTR